MSGRGQSMTWLRLHFPSRLDAGDVVAFVTNTVTDTAIAGLVFETESSGTGTVWRIGCTSPQAVRRLVKTHLPNVALVTDHRRLAAPLAAWRVTATGPWPFRTDRIEEATAGLLGSLAVSGEARTFHQLVLGSRLRPQSAPTTSLPGSTWLEQAASAVLVGNTRVPPAAAKRLQAKRALPGAAVTARLGIHDPQGGYRQLPGGYMAAWRTLATPDLRLGLRHERPELLAAGTDPRFRLQHLSLNATEIVTVLTWPVGDRSYPRHDRNQPATLPITTGSATRAGAGKSLGVGTYPGHHTRHLVLSGTDALRHTSVVGPTGVGKSTLLANMALADISNNRSVIVIDPKADLVDDLIARIPEQHLDRTVVLDPSRTDFVVGLNPLAAHTAETHQAVDGLVHVFKTMHSSSWGPRTEDILHASLLTLATRAKGDLATSSPPSLLDIPSLLTDPNYRHHALNGMTRLSPPLVSFWSWFETLSANERAHICAPLLNKLRPFTMRPNLAATMSAPEPFQLHRIFTERLVLLVPLRKAKIGVEAANLFASMVVAELWRTIQTRASIGRQRRHPAFVYADEFQDYLALPTEFADVLAQSRGLGVGWTLAHQNLDQLPTSLQRSVAANAQNKIHFRLGHDDAARIARHHDQLQPGDLTKLAPFHAYAQTLHNGRLNPTASIRTQPLSAVLRDHRRGGAQLARRWGTPPQLPTTRNPGHDPSHSDAPIGRKPRSDS